MSAGHTPTPWAVGNPPTRIIVPDRQGFNGNYRVADANQSAQLVNTPSNDEARANAAFIVLAVNSHNELVEALRSVTESSAWFEMSVTEQTSVRAALAKAAPVTA